MGLAARSGAAAVAPRAAQWLTLPRTDKNPCSNAMSGWGQAIMVPAKGPMATSPGAISLIGPM